MVSGGHNKRPYLAAVREGTRRGTDMPVVLPPSSLMEPEWDDLLPGTTDGERRVRERCAALWLKLSPVMSRSIGLVFEQQECLVEYCIHTARIEQMERQLSIEGLIVQGQRGDVKNPLVTVLNQYRAHRRGLTAELGLSPSAASRLVRPDQQDGDDPFD